MIAPLCALALTLAGCGSDDGDETTTPDQATQVGGDGAVDDAGSARVEGSGDSAVGSDGDAGSADDDEGGVATEHSADDLRVVWPLPPGDFEPFLPYQLIDDEFQYSEFAAFQTSEVSMDDILDHYRQYFPTIGFEVGELELGESIALNLTNPDDPAWTGVVQAGVTSDGVVTVSQNYSDPKD